MTVKVTNIVSTAKNDMIKSHRTGAASIVIMKQMIKYPVKKSSKRSRSQSPNLEIVNVRERSLSRQLNNKMHKKVNTEPFKSYGEFIAHYFLKQSEYIFSLYP